MRQNKRYFIFGVTILLLATLLTSYRLPFYIYKPGSADALNAIVQVENGFESEGDMHLVTVRGGRATPLLYLWAKFQPFHQIEKLEDARPEGMNDNEYFELNLHMMETSQEAAKILAYEAANKEIKIEYNGVYVMYLLEGMPASEVLKVGDRITQVDEKNVEKAEDLITYVEPKKEGDSVILTIERKGKTITEEVGIAPFPEAPEKFGIGISLVTDREVVVDPPISILSGDIGGPSAGLMFSLEIYDQLTPEDLTKGYEIAGTGKLNYDGTILRIGGIDKKIAAAHKEGCEIFFAPNEAGTDEYETNYQIAVRAAEELGTGMKIVPVDTFQDALLYLQQLEPKK